MPRSSSKPFSSCRTANAALRNHRSDVDLVRPVSCRALGDTPAQPRTADKASPPFRLSPHTSLASAGKTAHRRFVPVVALRPSTSWNRATQRRCAMAPHKTQASGHAAHRQVTLKVTGYAAAAAFCAVSIFANLRYGLSLGKSPIDKTTYAVASVAADIFKIAVPLMALNLWERRRRSLGLIALMLWVGCVMWSLTSALGFALSTRDETVADRRAEASTRHGWEATVERAEAKLDTLGRHRPIGVIKADMAATAVATQIWRRSRQCTDLAREESRAACAPVLALRGSWRRPKQPSASKARWWQVAHNSPRWLWRVRLPILRRVHWPASRASTKPPSGSALPCCWRA